MSYKAEMRDAQGNIWKLKLASGNYRVYKNNREVYKSDGKKDSDLNDAKAYLDTALKASKNSQKVSPALQKNNEETRSQQDNLAQTFQKQADLTGQKADDEQLFSNYINKILAQSRQTGKEPLEILAEMSDEKDSQGNPVLSAHLFNRLYSAIEGNREIKSLEEIIREKQGDRRGYLDTLETLPEDKKALDNSTRDMLVNPNMGINAYQNIYQNLPENQRQNLTPEKLHQINTAKGLDTLQTEGEKDSSLYSRLMPKDNFAIDWNMPSLDKAKGLYDQWKDPNYVYGSEQPFLEREHQLGAAGHSTGSSTLENNETAKQGAKNREDIENIVMIQQALEREHRAKGDTIGFIDKLRQGKQAPLEQSLKTSEDILGKQFGREQDRYKNQQDLQTRIAEGGLNVTGAELGEDTDLHKIRAQQSKGEGETLQNTNDLVYQYLMKVQDIERAGIQKDQAFRDTEQSLWERRENVIIGLEQLALQKKELKYKVDELKQASKAKNYDLFFKVLGTIGSTAIATAIGGPAAGLAALAGSSFGLKGSPSQGWLNSGGNK